MTCSSRLAPVFLAALLATLTLPAIGQPILCNTSVSVAPIVRVEGNTEAVADMILSCTGGVATPVGLPVPQVNVSIFLNANLTSKTVAAVKFSEALLMIDEPNSPASSPRHPLLNCGQDGAPDNGIAGPGVCSITSTGDPATAYDGKKRAYGAGTDICDGSGGRPADNTYGCGRPNVYQARVGTVFNPSQFNAITFLGVPMEPPAGGTRFIRITNLRVSAAAFGASPTPVAIVANISINGPIAMSIDAPQQTVGYTQHGFTTTVPEAGTLRLVEGFTSSWKTRNVSATVGDNSGTPGNADFSGGAYTYHSPFVNYPLQIAQNVPGALYNTESVFQWQNAFPNGPPPFSPPPGYGFPPLPSVGGPLGSVGFGGLDTGISAAGSVNAGTRFALILSGGPPPATRSVPSVVFLYRLGSPPGSAPTGVMVLTSSDAAGAGPYTPIGTMSGDMAVYEVLYSNPFVLEYADIPVTLSLGHGHGPSAGSVSVVASFAPFYSTPGAGQPTPNSINATPTAVPRFVPGGAPIRLHP